MIYYHITEESSNAKTGKISVITSSSNTCPDVCPFKNNGCYGNGGPIKLHWDKVSSGDRGLTFEKLLEKIPIVSEKMKKKYGESKVRLWQVGDMPGLGNNIDVSQTKKLADTLLHFDKCFGYTHKPLTKKNKDAIKYCNSIGVIINLSANNLCHADHLCKQNIGPVSVTLPFNSLRKGVVTPEGRQVLICPAVLTNKSLTCKTCGGSKGALCWRRDRDYIIGFPAHGSGVKKASEVANGIEY